MTSGMQEELLRRQVELLFGEVRSTVESAMVWKAKSHAAYQGYIPFVPASK